MTRRSAAKAVALRQDLLVYFEVGLNSIIRKLRQGLNDDADHPHYIETLAKRGYRFLAPVTVTAVKGDPLAAALAAGETPSPEMVAASGESEGLRPVVAWALLAGVAVTVTAAILLSAQTTLYRRVPLEQPPEVLAERARDILRNAGYSEPPTDTAMAFYEGESFYATSRSMTDRRHVGTTSTPGRSRFGIAAARGRLRLVTSTERTHVGICMDGRPAA